MLVDYISHLRAALPELERNIEAHRLRQAAKAVRKEELRRERQRPARDARPHVARNTA